VDAILDEFRAEIDEQPEAFIAKAKVGEELLHVHRCDLFNRLQLDDDLLFDNEVGAKAFIKMYVIVGDRNRLLADDVKATNGQFMGQDGLINRFE